MPFTLNRIAAGMGAVVAVSLTGGLNLAVASADSGGRNSSASHGSSATHGSPVGHSRDGGRPRRDGAGPLAGPRRAHGAALRGGQRFVIEQVPERRVAVMVDEAFGTPATVTSRLTSNAVVTESSTPPTTSRLATTSVAPRLAANEFERLTAAASRGGLSHLGDAVLAVRPLVSPRVVFGNGRTPVASSGGPEDLSTLVNVVQSVIRLAPVMPPPPLPAPDPSPATDPMPAEQRTEWSPRTPVTALWGRVEPDWPAGVIFGIAGLLLTPLGGTWLGFRQARASRAASQLVSR